MLERVVAIALVVIAGAAVLLVTRAYQPHGPPGPPPPASRRPGGIMPEGEGVITKVASGLVIAQRLETSDVLESQQLDAFADSELALQAILESSVRGLVTEVARAREAGESLVVDLSVARGKRVEAGGE